MKNLLKTVLVFVGLMGLSLFAWAQGDTETAHQITQAGVDVTAAAMWVSLIAVGTGIGLGLAAMGGSIGIGKAAAAALDGVARNPAVQPKIMILLILGLAFIESLVIYMTVIAFMHTGLLNKVMGSVFGLE